MVVARLLRCTAPRAAGCAALAAAATTAVAATCDGEARLEAASPEAALPPWRLVFEDQFEGPEGSLPDPAKWSYHTKSNNWTKDRRHNERQWYMDSRSENSHLSGHGTLRIIARKEDWVGGEYTSARIRTRRRPGGDFAPPCRVEVVAKLPAAAPGLWPAIWCMSTESRFGGWPFSGEVDIMEHVGFEPGVVHSTVHTEAFNWRSQSANKATLTGVSHESFHTFVAEWDAELLTVAMDGAAPHYVFRNAGGGPADWPFGEPFYLMLNLAVGGNWGGKRGIDETALPAVFEVCSVRIFRRAGAESLPAEAERLPAEADPADPEAPASAG